MPTNPNDRRTQTDPPTPAPHWDAGSRTLWLGGRRLKEFRDHAGGQVVILAAFERLGWPPRVEDPLPKQEGRNLKRRLRETVKNLQRSLRGTPLRFRMDGTGHAVRVEVADEGGLSTPA